MRVARAMRLAGYALVFVAGEPLWMQPTCWDWATLGLPRFSIWAATYAAFAIAFHASASAPEDARRRRGWALGAMIAASVAMDALLPCEFGSLSLVVVGSQAALLLTPRQTAALIAALAPALLALLLRWVHWPHAVSHVVGLVAGAGFAAAAAHAARREERAARDLARANAELRATRALLEETSRAEERTRIARELHDVLGHDLTALGLQLEVATHVPADRAATHVAKAREVTARLLSNVREVAASMRDEPAASLGAALRTLVEGLPGMTVHLDVPDDLDVEDAARAHCILRCVQEIVTNALRHARGASNLWITIARADGAITLDARDDGRGASDVHAGQGLSGMRARLEEMGGRLRVGAEPSRAFAVSAWLPAKGGAR